jgi:hypothetical protein
MWGDEHSSRCLAGRCEQPICLFEGLEVGSCVCEDARSCRELNDRFVEITSGIEPSAEVVTRGAYSLSFSGASNGVAEEALDAAHGHEHAAMAPNWSMESLMRTMMTITRRVTMMIMPTKMITITTIR